MATRPATDSLMTWRRGADGLGSGGDGGADDAIGADQNGAGGAGGVVLVGNFVLALEEEGVDGVGP